MPLYGVTPMSPVSSRLVFWIPKDSRFFLPLSLPFCFVSPGNCAVAVAAVLAEVLLLQPGAGEQRQVVRAGDLPLLVVAVRGDDVGVEGLQLLGVLLHRP